MKATHLLVLLCSLAFPARATGVVADGDRTITKVIKLLQGMLDSSKAASEEDSTLYAKFKCYCDDNTEEKTETIESKTKEIALLESSIEETLAANGKLAKESAKLDSDITATETKKADAATQRGKEADQFAADKADFDLAIKQMNEAISVLTALSGDQTLAAGADHDKFMANYDPKKQKTMLLKLKAQMKTVLTAAAALAPREKSQPILALLEVPTFTATYTSQSVEVVGILKEMLSTFEDNLKEAVGAENRAIEAHTKLTEILDKQLTTMRDLLLKKQNTMSSNDDKLATDKASLSAAQGALTEAQDFLATLTTMCKTKKEEYESRKLMRANEDAAIAQAIAILNSDQAFETFGKVSATTTGATGATTFLQLSRSSELDASASALIERLNVVESSKRSMKFAKVLYMVRKGNPFTKVVDEIGKMLKLIEQEGATDQENLDYCNQERNTKNGYIDTKSDQITELAERETTLTNNINDPQQGLLFQIQEAEKNLVENSKSKAAQTKTRQEEQLDYQKDIKTLVEAEDLLSKAISVLKKYYDNLKEKVQFVQKKKDDPAPPATWEKYDGQSSKGGDAITMLEFILSETKKEKTTAMADESKAQQEYEDAMAELVKSDGELQTGLVTLKASLAESEKELAGVKDNLQSTKSEKEALEAYLEKIKPGCDFITTNFDTREANRAEEKKQLEFAIGELKKTPAYIAAEQKAKEESYGKCKATCVAEGETHAKCKACLADVTVVGYCAGNPGTPGC